jgi:uncharacterized BrkB/YihY/UPF0761 family membrane protein
MRVVSVLGMLVSLVLAMVVTTGLDILGALLAASVKDPDSTASWQATIRFTALLAVIFMLLFGAIEVGT